MKELKFDAPSSKIVTTVSSELLDLDARPEYQFVEFTNIGSNNVFLAFSGNTAVVNKGTTIFPGGTFTMIRDFLAGAGKVNCISSAGGEIICITTAR